MKVKVINIPKESPEIKFITILPVVMFAKDKTDENEIGNIFILFLFWGVNFNFTRPKIVKKYAVCKQPIPMLLTRGREYEIIKSIGLSYVVKRDDDSIDRISKTRFENPFEK